MPAFLELDGLAKRFDSGFSIDGISLGMARGEMLALLGPSGSGKTTVLRLLAGFETPDGGHVRVDGEDVTGTDPVHRRFGMVFQHYALFPHLDVGENVTFGLESIGVRGEELSQRVARALTLVDLAGYERRRVGQLSGGQQQRVALARALAPEPRVLLLDEPLSNLDPTLRERTRRELREVIRRVGITTVLVTHEQEEAFELGDRVAVMRDGNLEQVGAPEELYSAPATAFVAGFVGRAGKLEVEVIGRGERGVRVRLEGVEWELELDRCDVPTGPARLIVRPEALRIAPEGPGALGATVTSRRFTGPTTIFQLMTDAGTPLEVLGAAHTARVGERVGIMPSRRAGGGLHLFAADVS